MPFPLIKLGSLLFKQLSKPLAASFKAKAKTNPYLRRYICIPPAQFYNWANIHIRMRLLGLGKPSHIEQLSEKEALELGSNILGESIVFIAGVSTIVFEYLRQLKNTQSKENIQNERIDQLEEKIREYIFQLEETTTKQRELERLIHAQGNNKSKNFKK
ncbi:hypothetical protein SNEBB_001464 [Seison nebaliae]|nr:hypothetical protein SNEBB_001464 [Seison nebaliae]